MKAASNSLLTGVVKSARQSLVVSHENWSNIERTVSSLIRRLKFASGPSPTLHVRLLISLSGTKMIESRRLDSTRYPTGNDSWRRHHSRERGHVMVVECRSSILSQLSRHRTTVAPSTGDVGVVSACFVVQLSSTLRPACGEVDRVRRPRRTARRAGVDHPGAGTSTPVDGWRTTRGQLDRFVTRMSDREADVALVGDVTESTNSGAWWRTIWLAPITWFCRHTITTIKTRKELEEVNACRVNAIDTWPFKSKN